MNDISDSSCSAPASDEVSSSTDAAILRVATFNTLNGQVHRGKHKHYFKGPIRVNDLVESVCQFDADIVGLQEVDRRTVRTRFANAVKRVARRTGHFATFRPSRRHWLIGLFGNSLVTRQRHHNVQVVKLRRLHWREQKRTALFATVEHNGVPVRVATTHLSSRRDESAIQLPQIFDEMTRHRGPALIFGDMNLRPHEALPVFESAGWTVVETGPTWPSWDPSLRIDYIAVREMQPVTARVQKCKVSDHCAIVAELVVK